MKIVAAFVNCNVALTADQNVKALVKSAGRNLLKGAEAGLAVSLEDFFKSGRCLHVELIHYKRGDYASV